MFVGLSWTTMSLFLLVSLAVATLEPWPVGFELVNPKDGEEVDFLGRLGSQRLPLLFVESDANVVLNRITRNSNAWLSPPIRNSVVIVKRSGNCSNTALMMSPTVTTESLNLTLQGRSVEPAVKISIQTGVQNAQDMQFMDSSTLRTAYTCPFQFGFNDVTCTPSETPSELTTASASEEPSQTPSTEPGIAPSSSQPITTSTAEPTNDAQGQRATSPPPSSSANRFSWNPLAFVTTIAVAILSTTSVFASWLDRPSLVVRRQEGRPVGVTRLCSFVAVSVCALLLILTATTFDVNTMRFLETDSGLSSTSEDIVASDMQHATTDTFTTTGAATPSLDTQASSTIRRSLQDQQCTVNVEILYLGCHVEAVVIAPQVKLRNLNFTVTATDSSICFGCVDTFQFLETDDPYWDTLDGYDATLMNNNISQVTIEDGRLASLVTTSSNDDCFQAVGRPFRDNRGNSVFSKQVVPSGSDEEQNSLRWSAQPQDAPFARPDHIESMRVPETKRSHLAEEWTQRALEEHASIASFASFTIALMSNQAPPDLIHDALSAAQDELRHAKVSFEIASLLAGGKPVEPLELPPSDLHYSKNLTALALGAAREGCVEETLSALQLGVEVEYALTSSNCCDELDELLANETRIIALEEAEHSVLAWRTVAWVCTVDTEVCDTVKRKVLNQHKLLDYAQNRFRTGSPEATLAWQCIQQALLPLLAAAEIRSFPAGANCFASSKSDRGGNLVTTIADRIIQGVTGKVVAKEESMSRK